MLGFANLKEVWDVPKKKEDITPYPPFKEKEEVIDMLRPTPPLQINEKPHIEPVVPVMESMDQPIPEEDNSNELVIRITNPAILNALKIYNDGYKQEMIMNILEKGLLGVQENFVSGKGDVDLFMFFIIAIAVLFVSDCIRSKYFMKK